MREREEKQMRWGAEENPKQLEINRQIVKLNRQISKHLINIAYDLEIHDCIHL